MPGDTNGGETEFTPVLTGDRVARSIAFCVLFFRLLFVPFLAAIVLSVLLFTESDYPLDSFLRIQIFRNYTVEHSWH